MKFELGTCKNCGGDAALVTQFIHTTGNYGAYVHCTVCGNRTATQFDGTHDGAFVLNAISAWNRTLADEIEEDEDK